MDQNKTRSWLTWALPFLISAGLAIGALIGFSFSGNMIQQEGPAGELAGAAGAVLVLICTVMGFLMSMFTVIVAKILKRKRFDYSILRFGLSIAGGGIIGAIGSNDGTISIVVTWMLLFGLPVILSWSWRMRSTIP